jgi:glycosylphosphatidylinositol transamidase (GPIT) subunit GPI8
MFVALTLGSAQFILHAALDLVDEMQWKTQTTFLRTIDRYNDLFISAMVTHGSVRMLLLHEAKNDEAIRSFFTEVHELYIRVLLNPFYDVNTRIKSPSFDSRVKLIAQSHLRGGNK